MTRSARLKGLMSAVGCLLLPLSVGADSRLADQDGRATAHLMFKIVIPQVLSVEIGQTLTIGGKDHSEFMLANRAEGERHQVIMRGSGHRSIAQFAACTQAGTRDTAVLHCTVSMP